MLNYNQSHLSIFGISSNLFDDVWICLIYLTYFLFTSVGCFPVRIENKPSMSVCYRDVDLLLLREATWSTKPRVPNPICQLMHDSASTTIFLYIFAANQLITGASSPKCWVAAVWCASASEMEAQGPSKRSERNWPSHLTPDALRHEARCLFPCKNHNKKSKHTFFIPSRIAPN